MSTMEATLERGEAPPRIPALLAQPNRAWHAAVLLAVVCLGIGLLGFLTEHHQGSIATGMRNPGYGGASWGLYIVFDVFFVGVSFVGIAVAVIARLFRVRVLVPVTRIALLLTLACLVAAAASVVADQGRPLRALLDLPRLARPSSPFFGTFTMVEAGYLSAALVFFFLSVRPDASRMAGTVRGPLSWFHRIWASGWRDLPEQRLRHRRVSLWLSLGILPMLVIAHSTLGFVFGIQSGRPGWFGALSAPSFVVLAAVSGVGVLILVALWFRWMFRLRDRIPDETFRWLGNFLWALTLVYLYFMFVEELTATYAAPEADRRIAREITWGHFAPLYWLTIGNLLLAFFIPFSLYLRRKTSISGVALAAALANVAAISKRMLIVIPSQTHGGLVQIEQGVYDPTWVEYAVVVGLVGLVCMTLLVFGRVLPLVPTEDMFAPVADGSGRSGLVRRAVTGLCALLALGLVVTGLADSFRLLRPEQLDPLVPYSPVMFAAGVVLLFGSAVVYELLPDRKLST